MEKLTRRDFTSLMLASSVLPFAGKDSTNSAHTEETIVNLSKPNSIAGHVLTPQEQELTSKFLARHEEDLDPLRSNDLPNNVAPAFCYTSELSTPR